MCGIFLLGLLMLMVEATDPSFVSDKNTLAFSFFSSCCVFFFSFFHSKYRGKDFIQGGSFTVVILNENHFISSYYGSGYC